LIQLEKGLMIDLTRLTAFIYAAESLSFSEAAGQLHLTQPTVSHHIKRLETTLGEELFTRSGHTLKLTEDGRLLLPFAHKLVHQAGEVQEMMSSLQEKIAGHLRIACSATAAKYILPQLAGRFCRRFPGTAVSILACTPQHVVPRLLEGEANLAGLRNSSGALCTTHPTPTYCDWPGNNRKSVQSSTNTPEILRGLWIFN
jgi:DNA-binding transcriptional LysR family regulator